VESIAGWVRGVCRRGQHGMVCTTMAEAPCVLCLEALRREGFACHDVLQHGILQSVRVSGVLCNQPWIQLPHPLSRRLCWQPCCVCLTLVIPQEARPRPLRDLQHVHGESISPAAHKRAGSNSMLVFLHTHASRHCPCCSCDSARPLKYISPSAVHEVTCPCSRARLFQNCCWSSPGSQVCDVDHRGRALFEHVDGHLLL
jgi:hypothetical protein